MNSIINALITGIPSLANSIIQVKGLELVWQSHGLTKKDDVFDVKQKYLELTGNNLDKADAIAFQHNIEDSWSIYAMESHVLLFFPQESYILDCPDGCEIKRISTVGLERIWSHEQGLADGMNVYEKYIAFTGSCLNKNNAIAFQYDNGYKETRYEMPNLIVVITEGRSLEFMDGSYIYKK